MIENSLKFNIIIYVQNNVDLLESTCQSNNIKIILRFLRNTSTSSVVWCDISHHKLCVTV